MIPAICGKARAENQVWPPHPTAGLLLLAKRAGESRYRLRVSVSAFVPNAPRRTKAAVQALDQIQPSVRANVQTLKDRTHVAWNDARFVRT